jgi:hypothetical protein
MMLLYVLCMEQVLKQVMKPEIMEYARCSSFCKEIMNTTAVPPTHIDIHAWYHMYGSYLVKTFKLGAS